MAGKQAKILSDDQVERLLSFASTTRNPLRNRVLVLLSLKADLRAGEIANLTWPMVLGAEGGIAPVIELRDHAATKASGPYVSPRSAQRPGHAGANKQSGPSTR
jgi:integrase